MNGVHSFSLAETYRKEEESLFFPVNIRVHVSLLTLDSLVCMPSSGIAGSYGSSISSV